MVQICVSEAVELIHAVRALSGTHSFVTEDKCALEGEPVSCASDGNALSARDPLYEDREPSLPPSER